MLIFLRNEAVFPRLNLCGPLSLRFSSTDKKGFDDIQRTVKRLREEVEIQQLDEPKVFCTKQTNTNQP